MPHGVTEMFALSLSAGAQSFVQRVYLVAHPWKLPCDVVARKATAISWCLGDVVARTDCIQAPRSNTRGWAQAVVATAWSCAEAKPQAWSHHEGSCSTHLSHRSSGFGAACGVACRRKLNRSESHQTLGSRSIARGCSNKAQPVPRGGPRSPVDTRSNRGQTRPRWWNTGRSWSAFDLGLMSVG